MYFYGGVIELSSKIRGVFKGASMDLVVGEFEVGESILIVFITIIFITL